MLIVNVDMTVEYCDCSYGTCYLIDMSYVVGGYLLMLMLCLVQVVCVSVICECICGNV